MQTKNPRHLWKQWKKKHSASFIIFSILMILGLFGFWYFYEANPISIILAFSIGSFGLWKIYNSHLPDLKETISLIHDQNPALEYSGNLIISEDPTTLLAVLQKEKAIEAFGRQDYKLPLPSQSIQHSTLWLLSILVFLIAVQSILGQKSSDSSLLDRIKNKESEIGDSSLREESYVSQFNLRVEPPRYTGVKTKNYSNINIEIPEASIVTWNQSFQNQPDIVFLIINDQDTIDLRSPYSYSKIVNSSLFYRYGWEARDSTFISEYRQIKIIPDVHPNVNMTGVEEYSKVLFRKNLDLDFTIDVLDDYGIDDIQIIATIAKGSGESVQFREKNIPIKDFRKGSKSYQGKHNFSINELKMSPGDELYWYVKAKDNCSFAEHWTKSTTHTFALEDTTQYTFADDGGMQVDLMPEFFRSQRQIIIDSEKLLAKKHLISKDSFNRESNALGYDQKMLRLKYGQFLGEESESGIAIENEVELDHDDAHDHEEDVMDKARNVLEGFMHDHDHEDEAMNNTLAPSKDKEDPSRPSWVEELSHNHDNMEEATYFEMSVKSKLKAALNVMWDAELHLRLYDPSTSLPYQYESLGYLQEIKNHARIYVQRMGFDPPVIKEAEKRLKGKQEEIVPSKLNIVKEVNDEYGQIRKVIAILGTANVDPNAIQGLGSTLATIILKRPEILPLLGLWQDYIKRPSTKSQESLRKELIKILPVEAENINNNSLQPHEITRQVALKMSRRR